MKVPPHPLSYSAFVHVICEAVRGIIEVAASLACKLILTQRSCIIIPNAVLGPDSTIVNHLEVTNRRLHRALYGTRGVEIVRLTCKAGSFVLGEADC